MDGFAHKRIADPVHKTIGLSEVEARVIDTAVFRRLRRIKQLGLAEFIFPGASYPRFSHSLGVCHVTGRLLDSIMANLPKLRPKISDKDFQRYRLAALLHDVGHYPFSHSLERAAKNFSVDRAALKPGSSAALALNHEQLGREVLAGDPELSKVLKECKFAPKEVSEIFTRESTDRFSNLISSDLDADRIDYLLRTAHATGLPYGDVDLEYLLSQLRLDDKGRISFHKRALRTAEHTLLCRYFDYQQVVFHKTVVGLELILDDILKTLLDRGTLDCSKERMLEMIKNGELHAFDDNVVWQMIRELAEDEDDIVRLKAVALLERRPPKLVGELEVIERRDESKSVPKARKRVERAKAELAKKFRVDESCWYIWYQGGKALTSIGSHVPLSLEAKEEEGDIDLESGVEQIVRILQEDGTSRPIMLEEQSLMYVLSDYAPYALRVYVVLDSKQESKRDRIAKAVKEAME